jgi:hypothetical protein
LSSLRLSSLHLGSWFACCISSSAKLLHKRWTAESMKGE